MTPDLQIVVVTKNTATVRGDRVAWVLDRLDCRRQFTYKPVDGGSPCWTVPAAIVADVAAMAELLHGAAEIHELAS